MEIYIIGGFLGSGKTTLLNHIKDNLPPYLKKKDIVIIENDHGKAGVDAQVLDDDKTIITRLSGGCICCSIAGDLIEAIKTIVIEHHPMAIFIELTGIAKPYLVKASLMQYLQIKADKIQIMTLIDTVRFHKIQSAMPMLTLEQIKDADIVILTKASQNASSTINHLALEIKEKLEFAGEIKSFSLNEVENERGFPWIN